MDRDRRQAAQIPLLFDPEGLTGAQRDGTACVVCHGKWPRPRHRVGRLPDNAPVNACDDCVDTLAWFPAASAVAAHR